MGYKQRVPGVLAPRRGNVRSGFDAIKWQLAYGAESHRPDLSLWPIGDLISPVQLRHGVHFASASLFMRTGS